MKEKKNFLCTHINVNEVKLRHKNILFVMFIFLRYVYVVKLFVKFIASNNGSGY